MCEKSVGLFMCCTISFYWHHQHASVLGGEGGSIQNKDTTCGREWTLRMYIYVFQGDGQRERGIYIKSVVPEGAAAIVSQLAPGVTGLPSLIA